MKEGTIKSSLYKSASKEGISPNIIIEFARLYGFQIDFQRDIRKNDSYQIIYETFIDENNEIFSTGEIVYANLVLRGQSNQLYFYPDKKFFGHYDENGNPPPRGSAGTLPWVTNVDLSLSYYTQLMGNDVSLKATVYNLLDADSATNINEERTHYGDNGIELNPNYGIVTGRQAARYMSFTARMVF